MEQQTNTKLNAASPSERKAYRKPQLVEYGRVGDLTKGGYVGDPTEDAVYTSAG